jgi:folate-dependent phosphoribosylglycinamide formyltransferase PurN|tara:strand:+ start:39 stop:572 length:534 start_codon:yes stop_codon:yes gene_type:complete
MEDTKWIAFFSQTGSEIADIAEALGRWPDRIITNERPEHLRTIDPRIEERNYWTFPNKPTEENYLEVLTYFPDALVTLHGWLRIVPKEVCNRSNIFNGHPGLITKYPELKGKDPQVKAFELKHKVIGSVIHKVSAGVDEGEIISSNSVEVKNIGLEETFTILRKISLELWVDFLENY